MRQCRAAGGYVSQVAQGLEQPVWLASMPTASLSMLVAWSELHRHANADSLFHVCNSNITCR